MEYIPKPDSYSSFIGTASLLLASLCLAISFCESNKSHATKLFSIMLVAALSFFSSHWTTYFAAIFIVATAVTELEFLQNLAAIIRKDENYFNYKKEALSKAENIRRKVEDVIEEEYEAGNLPEPDRTDIKINLATLKDLTGSARMKLSFEVEEKALDFLSKDFGRIERGVRFRKDGSSVEFDGVVSNGADKEDILFEVKWTRNPDHSYMFAMHSIKKCVELIEVYQSITGRSPRFNLVMVTNTKNDIPTERLQRLSDKANESNIKLIHLSLKEIGFEVTNDIA